MMDETPSAKSGLLSASPFQSLRTRSRAKQQAAGGVLAATLLAGQTLYEVKQSHILRPGVPRKVVLTVGSQAITLLQSVKTMKPLETYQLQHTKAIFRHEEGSFTFHLRNQGGREIVFISEETMQIEADIMSRSTEHEKTADEHVTGWLQDQGISDPQMAMTQGAIRVLKKRNREPGAWAGILQQMSDEDAAHFIGQAAAHQGDEMTSEEEEEDEEAMPDTDADRASAPAQKIFGFRDRLPQNLVEAKSLAAKAKASIQANIAGDDSDDDSDDEEGGGFKNPNGDDFESDDGSDDAMDYVADGSDAGSASAESDNAGGEDFASDFSSDAGSDGGDDFMSDASD